MEKAQLSNRERGIKAGMLTFFLGPLIGGAAFGLVFAVASLIAALAGGALVPKTAGEVLLAPFVVLLALLLVPPLFAMCSFVVVALPAALAATYVSIRVGMTARMSWTETVVLSIVCLAYTRGAPGLSRWVFALDDWRIFVAFSSLLAFCGGHAALYCRTAGIGAVSWKRLWIHFSTRPAMRFWMAAFTCASRPRVSAPGSMPCFMAAACPAAGGETVLEAGCGAGVASLCLLARVKGIAVTGVEADPALAALARENAAANGFGDCFEAVAADVAAALEQP